MSQHHLICYLGRNSSGKSFRANQLVETQNYVKVSMADALRELAWKTLGWKPKCEVEYNMFKIQYLTEKVKWKSDGINGKQKGTINENVTGRQYLQNLGQGAKDLFGEDFWVKQWEKTIEDIQNKIYKKNVISNIESNAKIDCSNVIHIVETRYKTLEQGLFDINHFELVSLYDRSPNDNYLKDTIIIHPKNPLLNDTKAKITTDDIRFPIEVESAHKLGATFIWCDYPKGNYPIEEHPSEALANRILASGKYQDGDEISFDELKTFFE